MMKDRALDATQSSIYWYYDYVKHLTTISIALLGLLITLKPDTFQDLIASYLFLATIILLGLGILFSLAFRFSEGDVRSELASIYLRSERNNEDQINDTGEPDEPFRIGSAYRFCWALSILCLSLSIISLIAYACVEIL